MSENFGENIDVKADTQSNDLSFVDKIIQKLSQESSTDSLSKAGNMVLEKIDLEIKYNLEKNNILLDTQELITNSLKNTLPTHLQEYNVASFDTDNNGIIDQTEEQNYLQELAKMLNHILKLQSAQKFKDIHEEVDGYWQTQINGYERTEKFLNEYGIDEYLRPDITEHELSEMKERNFDFSSTDSWKEIGILIGNEAGESVKDVLKMLASSLSTLGLIGDGKYFSRFGDLLDQRASNDPNTAQEAAIKVEELIRTNPILGLVELFGEQGIEMIKNLGEMIQSGKQGDIATKITMFFGLLSGGVGATKVISKFKSSKKAPTSAVEVNSPNEGVIPGNIEEIAAETTKEVTEEAVSQGVNTGNQAITQSVGETQFSSEQIDYQSQKIKERISIAEAKSGISREEVFKNANLSDFDRGVEAESILGKSLSDNQKQVIVEIHNKSKGVYVERNAFGKDYDLNAMWNEAKTYFPDFSEFGLLVRHGILGKINIHDFLLSKKGETLSSQQLLDVLNNGDFKYGGDFSLTMLNEKLKTYGFPKVTDENFGEIMNLHKVNVSVTETKKWFGEQSAQNLYEATNNPEINDLLVKFKQKPSSLTPEQTQLVLHVGERAKGTEGQLIFDSQAEVEELRNRFMPKESNLQEEVLKPDTNEQNREEIQSLETSKTGIETQKMPEKVGVQEVDPNSLPRNKIINGLNIGEIDINKLSYSTFVGVRNDWEKLFKSSPENIQLEMLKAGHPSLYSDKLLTYILSSLSGNISDKKVLEILSSYFQPNGKLYNETTKYFNPESLKEYLNSKLYGKNLYNREGLTKIEAIINGKPFWGDTLEYFNTKSGGTLNTDELVLGLNQCLAKNLEEFNDWLDGFDIQGITQETFREVQEAVKTAYQK